MNDLGQLTDNEKTIIREVRNLKPYEDVLIKADVLGRPDTYVVHKSHKILLATGKLPEHLKVKLHDNFQ